MTKSSLHGDVLAVVQRRAKALVERDAATVDRLLAPDFVYTNASGAVFDKAAYLNRYVTAADVTWFSQAIVESSVRGMPGGVILLARIHDRARFGDFELDAEFRTTQVYRREGEAWLYVAGHTSAIGN